LDTASSWREVQQVQGACTALDDLIYREVHEIIAALGAYQPLSARDRGRLTQKVFAVRAHPLLEGIGY
jgi:hypothetical protein